MRHERTKISAGPCPLRCCRTHASTKEAKRKHNRIVRRRAKNALRREE